MGCDIHMFAEVREGQAWQSNARLAFDDPEDLFDGEIYDGRNYHLFALLADVRNYNNLEPMALPRGLPKDVSEGVAATSAEWGVDGHSHSWFGLPELLTFDYDQTASVTSGFALKEAKTAEGQIEHWGYTTVYPRFRDSTAPHKKLTWDEPLRIQCGNEWWWLLQKLCKLAIEEKRGELDAVRIVFWFDN